jgi:hypothetical protein
MHGVSWYIAGLPPNIPLYVNENLGIPYFTRFYTGFYRYAKVCPYIGARIIMQADDRHDHQTS